MLPKHVHVTVKVLLFFTYCVAVPCYPVYCIQSSMSAAIPLKSLIDWLIIRTLSHVLQFSVTVATVSRWRVCSNGMGDSLIKIYSVLCCVRGSKPTNRRPPRVLPDREETHGGEKAPNGSKRPYIAVKGPHRSEQVKGQWSAHVFQLFV